MAFISALFNAEAADSAADAQVAASDKQIDLLKRIYEEDTARNQPLIGLRDNTLGQISGLRGYGGGSLQQQPQAQPYQQQFNPFGVSGEGIVPVGQRGAFQAANPFANYGGQSPYAMNAGQPQQRQGQPQQQPGVTQDAAMQSFYNSPEYKMALMGFEDQGDNYIASQAALGGLYSGATMKGLSNLERRNAFSAFGDYRGNLMQEAGLGQAGAANQQQSGANFGNQAGASYLGQGDARAQSYTTRGSAYGNAFGQSAGAAARIILGG